MSGMRPFTQNPRLVVVPRQAIPGAIRLIRGILKHQKWRDGETLVSRGRWTEECETRHAAGAV